LERKGKLEKANVTAREKEKFGWQPRQAVNTRGREKGKAQKKKTNPGKEEALEGEKGRADGMGFLPWEGAS